ncbi:MAG: hypothetical protein L6Q76_23350 [Polyangiaceae bacterium]|nr:hypothetical protein [Polyangiaceae bacterium]
MVASAVARRRPDRPSSLEPSRLPAFGRLFSGLSLAAALSAAGCGQEPGSREDVASRSEAVIVAPLPAAYCSIEVDGKGSKATETDYLPHVVQCENGGADLQALKAQAIAARSVAYYNMANQGSICDGQGCQVYSCGAQPSAIHYQAVEETSGQYLSYDELLTYAFYVAGDKNAPPPGCVGNTANSSTEKWVTYNDGKTGGDVQQTALGFIGPPGFGQNRGCMSQWGARCLESAGRDALGILQFYYGADIQILTAPGPCVKPVLPPLAAEFVGQGANVGPDPTGQAQFEVCAGQAFHFWFELKNVGSASWVDWGDNGKSFGQNVRLGVPGDEPDVFTGTARISINENANLDVHPASWDPPGGECNDASFCQRTIFTANGIQATAPSETGIYKTTWQLVDEGRAWFGPVMWLSFNVIDCGEGAGGSSGSTMTAGGGGLGGSGGLLNENASGYPADSAGCCTGAIGAGAQASRKGFGLPAAGLGVAGVFVGFARRRRKGK